MISDYQAIREFRRRQAADFVGHYRRHTPGAAVISAERSRQSPPRCGAAAFAFIFHAPRARLRRLPPHVAPSLFFYDE